MPFSVMGCLYFWYSPFYQHTTRRATVSCISYAWKLVIQIPWLWPKTCYKYKLKPWNEISYFKCWCINTFTSRSKIVFAFSLEELPSAITHINTIKCVRVRFTETLYLQQIYQWPLYHIYYNLINYYTLIITQKAKIVTLFFIREQR